MRIEVSEQAGVDGMMALLDSLTNYAFTVKTEDFEKDMVIDGTDFNEHYEPIIKGRVWDEAESEFTEPVTVVITDDIVITYL